MRYFAVLLFSLGVGGVVYALSMRASEDEPITVGFEPDEAAAPAPPRAPRADGAAAGTAPQPDPGYAYLQVLVTRGPSWRERIQGLVGVMVLIVIGMALVAASIYAAGSVIDRTIQKFLGQ